MAYYKGAYGFGVFAPAGWNCRVWYGSSGAALIVTPTSIVSPYLPPPSFAHPVIEMSVIDGETSGRFDVARLGAMLFPDITRKYRKQIENEGILTNAEVRSDIEVDKYPTDSLTYLSKRAVEFQTPANKNGLGTEGYIKPANTPINGAVVLDRMPVGAAVLRASLGSKYQSWSSVILRLNVACMRSSDGC